MDVALRRVQPQRLDLSRLAADLQAVLRVMRQIILQTLAERLFLGGRLRVHVSSSSASSWLSVRAPQCSTVCSRGCRSRSEEGRVGKEGVRCRSRWSALHKKKKTQTEI